LTGFSGFEISMRVMPVKPIIFRVIPYIKTPAYRDIAQKLQRNLVNSIAIFPGADTPQSMAIPA
jgi:hypothetical protein